MLGREDRVMVRKYRVWPPGEEQQELGAPASRGRTAAYRRTHARILLPCDEHQPGGAMKDDGMARSPRAGSATAERVRRLAWRRVWSRPRGTGSRSTAVRRNRTIRESPA